MAKKKQPEKIEEVVEVEIIAELEEVKAKHPGGRPTIYTDELAETILNRLIQGECLESICKDNDMPCVTSVFEWRKKNKQFMKGYSRARKLQAEIFGDQIKLMVDKVVDQAEKCEETQGATLKIKGLVDAVKLRAGMYQWLAGKYNSKLFGDNSTQNIKQKTKVEVVSTDESRSKLHEALTKQIKKD